MEENQSSIFDTVLKETFLDRRQLLPWWMRFFIWFFIILSVLAVIVLIAALFGFQPGLALYGFQTNQPFSIVGLSVTCLFIYKGVVGYGLWFEKDWAISLGFVDAITGIALCSLAMIVPLMKDQPMTPRLELVVLIPYLLKLRKIQPYW